MSTYPLEKLLQMWKQGQLTADQMVGHLLQHVMALAEEVQALRKAIQNAPPRKAP